MGGGGGGGGVDIINSRWAWGGGMYCRVGGT
jgi:hypothetical protein